MEALVVDAAAAAAPLEAFNTSRATAVAQIPRGRNIILMQRIEALEVRLWYVK